MGMREWNLGAPEAHLLDRIRPRAGAVERDLVARPAADQVHHRLLAELPEKIPEGEIDRRDRRHRQFGPSVGHGGTEQLVADAVDTPGVGALEKAVEMIADQPAGRLTAKARGNAGRPVLRDDLDDDRPHDVDAPAQPARLVLRIARHRIGDQGANQPVLLALLEVVATRSLPGDPVGVDGGYPESIVHCRSFGVRDANAKGSAGDVALLRTSTR